MSSNQALSDIVPMYSPKLGDGYIPNLIIAGAPKCGTSSLHQWLVQSPDVVGSFEKETYFLSDPGTHMFRSTNSITNGLQSYTAHFPAAREPHPAVVLESTPSYIYSKLALDRLPDLPSRPKVIFVLREPSAQIYSLFRYFQTNWNWIPANVTFSDFLTNARAGNPPHYGGNELARDALGNARYVDFLLNWRDALGPDRFQIHLFEDLRRDPRDVIERVADFSGIDPSFSQSLDFAAHNQTVTVRSRALQDVNIALRARLPKGRLYEAARSVYRRLNTTLAPKVVDADRQALTQLKQMYRDANARLAKEFSLDLSSWT
jgi:hypothetical protein